MTAAEKIEASRKASALTLVGVEILKRFPLQVRREIIEEMKRVETGRA